MDSGAITGLTYMFIERERIYDMYEQICGARMTTNMGRIGGFERDFTPKFHELLKDFLKLSHQDSKNSVLIRKKQNFHGQNHRYRSYFCRKSIKLWFHRSNLRAAGVDYDVRVAQPYSS
jgi:NADH-quinone oxidoreductase subunit D